MTPLKIKVILGSTRQNRFGEKPAAWIADEAKKLENVEVELLDLRDYPMPFFDAPVSPTNEKYQYATDVVEKWAAKVKEADAYVMVSPEYNHGTSGVLKNALDMEYKGWNNKPVGFVSYGSVGGARAIEQLRLIAIELQMAPIRNAVHIPGSIVWGGDEWKPQENESLMKSAQGMLTQLLWWTKALKVARG